MRGTPGDLRPYWPYEMVLEVAQHLDELGVFWMEELLYRGDYSGMTALRNAVSMRIAEGEMTTKPYEFATLVERGCLDVLQPDCYLTGGITGTVEIARLADDADLMFSPHTWGNGNQFLANAHLAAGTTGSPYIEFPFDPPEWTEMRRDVGLTDTTRIDGEGWVVLSHTPGFGFNLDEEWNEATRVG